MNRQFQFSVKTLLIWVALPACVGAVVSCILAQKSFGFLLAVLWSAFFAWVAIRQTKNPAYTMLGCFAAFFLWPVFFIPIYLVLALLGLTDD